MAKGIVLEGVKNWGQRVNSTMSGDNGDLHINTDLEFTKYIHKYFLV